MKLVRLIFVVLCASISISLFAQQGERKVASATYGTSSLTYVSLSPWEFRPYDSTVTYGFVSSPAYGIQKTNGTGSSLFAAPLRLPEGSIVSYLEMYSCNFTVAPISSNFRVLRTSDNTFTSTTGPAGPLAPACGTTFVTITPVVIDNTTSSYAVEVSFPTSSQLVLSAYRVGYKLQISPDPATVTFTDVPVGHPLHRFVEALVAAGITGGCGGGNYCPDAPITRGQMAVFLSAALGLHWAP